MTDSDDFPIPKDHTFDSIFLIRKTIIKDKWSFVLVSEKEASHQLEFDFFCTRGQLHIALRVS